MNKTTINYKDFDEMKAHDMIEKGYEEAKVYLSDRRRLGSLIVKVERKMKALPYMPDLTPIVNIYVSLLRHYMMNQYRDVPYVALCVIVSSLLYLVDPFDYIPDSIPGIGLYDDKIVIFVCQDMVQPEIEDYREWRVSKGLE